MNRWLSIAMALAIALTFGTPRAIDAQPAPDTGSVTPIKFHNGQIAGLSPDGRSIAVFVPGTSICVFYASTIAKKSCAALDALDTDPGIDDIVWSPDSTRLAIAEIGLLLGRDGDLWVMDAASGALTNLTAEGYSGYLPTSISPDPQGSIFIDQSPAWTPDGQFITFSRSTWIDGSAAGTAIAQVPATGGEVEVLATVSENEPSVIRSRTAWSPDGTTFYFTREANNETAPSSNGIWSLTAATGEFTQVASAYVRDKGVLALLEVSPAGDRLLAWYPTAFGLFDVESPLLRLIDLATGEITVPVIPASDDDALAGLSRATFSPDGSALLHLIPTLGASDELWLLDLAGEETTLLLEGMPDPLYDGWMALSWGANGTVVIGLQDGGAIVTEIAGAAVDRA